MGVDAGVPYRTDLCAGRFWPTRTAANPRAEPTGARDSLIVPIVNTVSMQFFPDEVARRRPARLVVTVLAGARRMQGLPSRRHPRFSAPA